MKKPFSLRLRACAWGVIASLLTSGCQSWLELERVTDPLQELERILEKEPNQDPERRAQRETWLRLTRDWIERAELKAQDAPVLRGKISADTTETEAFLHHNGDSLNAWLEELNEPIEGLRRVVWASTRSATQGIQSPQESARDYAVSFFALRAIEHLAAKTELALLPLASALGMFPRPPAGSELLVSKFTTAVGLKVVTGQDLGRVAERLKLLTPSREVAGLFRRLALESRTKSKTLEDQSRSWREVDQASPEDAARAAQNLGQSAEARSLLAQTLLYVPGASFSITKFLSVVSNLTWGLINTAVGMGVILVAAVVSPFHESVDLPTFNLSRNGFQVWVGIRGMVYPAHAFSMGVWIFGSSSRQHDTGHEGGHSYQSALLGPLYLPAVGLSYWFQGHDESFMERWADAWAY